MKDFENLEKIGEGGMSEVWKAKQRSLGRIVAIKKVTASFTREPKLRERFKREAEIIASLQHPNIVHIYDYQVTQEGYSIIMEYIEGKDLGSLLKARDTFPLPIGIAILHQTAAALAHVHEQGIIHRDIKPTNILVSTAGSVKLSDFGIAKVEKVDQSLTQEGTLIGTPSYMAPEQIQGEEITFKVDIFTLGIILYEIVTGRHPFRERTIEATALKILACKPTPSRELNPSAPQVLHQAISKSLQKAPEKRYENISLLGRDLYAYLEQTRFGDIHQELKLWMRDSSEYTKTLNKKTINFKLTQAKHYLARGEYQVALKELDAVLKIDPHHSETLALIKEIQKQRKIALSKEETITLAELKIGKLIRQRWKLVTLSAFLLMGALALWLVMKPDFDYRNQTLEETVALKETAPVSKKIVKLEIPKKKPERVNKESALPVKEAIVKNGFLKIDCQPAPQMVFINKKEIPNFPFRQGYPLPPGKYTLKLINTKCEIYQTEIEIRRGEETVLEVSLNWLPGQLKIEAPKGTKVAIDENWLKDKAPFKRLIPLKKGKYTVKLYHPQLGERVRKVKIKPAEITSVKY